MKSHFIKDYYSVVYIFESQYTVNVDCLDGLITDIREGYCTEWNEANSGWIQVVDTMELFITFNQMDSQN